MVKYVFTVLATAMLACSPKVNYKAPISAEDLTSRTQELSLLERKSEMFAKDILRFKDKLEQENACYNVKETRECKYKLPLGSQIEFTKLRYSSEILVFHASSTFNGKVGMIRVKETGEEKQGILNKDYIEIVQINPPRHLYRKVVEEVFFLEENKDTGKLEEVTRDQFISCYDSLKQELPVKDNECVPPKISKSPSRNQK